MKKRSHQQKEEFNSIPLTKFQRTPPVTREPCESGKTRNLSIKIQGQNKVTDFIPLQNMCNLGSHEDNELSVSQIIVERRFGVRNVFRDYFRIDSANRPRLGQPPSLDLGPRVFLGARNVNYGIFSWMGIRHLYVNIYENPLKYCVIECSPNFSDSRGRSGAKVRENRWETRGIQWELISQDSEALIAGLRHWTQVYHDENIPYRSKRGPNSNSFIGWLVLQCGLDLTRFLSGWTYFGVDYWDSTLSTFSPSSRSKMNLVSLIHRMKATDSQVGLEDSP